MNREGYLDITSIDYSSVCIERLLQLVPKHKCGTMKYMVADITNLSPADFPNASFAVVVDKGTVDSILCGGSFQGIPDALSEVSRVLRPNGVFICVTYGSPCVRLRHLENDDYHWSVQVYTIEKMKMGDMTATSCNSMRVVWGGPFSCTAELRALDTADSNFVYVCKKYKEPG